MPIREDLQWRSSVDDIVVLPRCAAVPYHTVPGPRNSQLPAVVLANLAFPNSTSSSAVCGNFSRILIISLY